MRCRTFQTTFHEFYFVIFHFLVKELHRDLKWKHKKAILSVLHRIRKNEWEGDEKRSFGVREEFVRKKELKEKLREGGGGWHRHSKPRE